MYDLIIFGLGTRAMFDTERIKPHGIGLLFLEWLLKEQGLDWTVTDKYAYAVYEGGGLRVLLLTNRTAANKAWEALAAFLVDDGMLARPEPGNVVLIHDDTRLEQGKVTFSTKPTRAGGHRPVEGILGYLDSTALPRVRFGPHSIDFDRVLEDNGVFHQAFSSAWQSLSNHMRGLGKRKTHHAGFTETVAKLTGLWEDNYPELEEVVEALNGPERDRSAELPPTTVAITRNQYRALNRAVEEIIRALQGLKYGDLRDNLRGVHEKALWELAKTCGFRLGYLNLDFHAGHADLGLEVALIECNATMGAPQDVMLLEEAFNPIVQAAGLGLVPATVDPRCSGLRGVVNYLIKSTLQKTPGLVAVVNVVAGQHLGHDGHAEALYELLCEEGISAELVAAEDLELKSDGVYYEGDRVSFVWARKVYVGDRLSAAEREALKVVFSAQAHKCCQIAPAPQLQILTQKGVLPLLSRNPNLSSYVPFTDYLDDGNVDILRAMVRLGIKMALKPIVGGGSRGTEMLDKHDGDWPRKVSSFLASPAHGVIQAVAPKFVLPGTDYDFDIRALVFPQGRNPNVSYSARVYRRGSPKLLGGAPVYVLNTE